MTSLAPWAIGRATVNRGCASSRSARGGGSLDHGIPWAEWLTQTPVVCAAEVFLCALWQRFATVTVGRILRSPGVRIVTVANRLIFAFWPRDSLPLGSVSRSA
jgi:hypothetical protein